MDAGLAEHPAIIVAAPTGDKVEHPPNTFFVEIGRPFNVSLSLPHAESSDAFTVRTKTGAPVPTWLHLDTKTGMIGGTPYFDAAEEFVDVVVSGEGVIRELRIVLQEVHDDGRSEFASIWAESVHQ